MSVAETLDPAFPAVLAAAQREGLGAHQASFVPARKTALAITMLVMGIALLIVGLGIVVIALAFTDASLNPRLRKRRLHLFENGLVLANAKGPTVIFRWDQVTVLQEIFTASYNGIPAGTKYIYTLSAPDGHKKKITGFYSHPEQWGPAIQDGVTRAQLPRTLGALDAGAVLTFGPLTINQGGISSGRSALRWDEIGDMSVVAGYLQVKKVGQGRWSRWSSKPIKMIPNFFVFAAAATQLRQNYLKTFTASTP